MGRKFAEFLAGVMFLLFVFQASAAEFMVKQGTNLNARSGPSTQSEKVLSLSGGSVVNEIERKGVWSRVVTNDGTRVWVHNGYLETALTSTHNIKCDVVQSWWKKYLFGIKYFGPDGFGPDGSTITYVFGKKFDNADNNLPYDRSLKSFCKSGEFNIAASLYYVDHFSKLAKSSSAQGFFNFYNKSQNNIEILGSGFNIWGKPSYAVKSAPKTLYTGRDIYFREFSKNGDSRISIWDAAEIVAGTSTAGNFIVGPGVVRPPDRLECDFDQKTRCEPKLVFPLNLPKDAGTKSAGENSFAVSFLLAVYPHLEPNDKQAHITKVAIKDYLENRFLPGGVNTTQVAQINSILGTSFVIDGAIDDSVPSDNKSYFGVNCSQLNELWPKYHSDFDIRGWDSSPFKCPSEKETVARSLYLLDTLAVAGNQSGGFDYYKYLRDGEIDSFYLIRTGNENSEYRTYGFKNTTMGEYTPGTFWIQLGKDFHSSGGNARRSTEMLGIEGASLLIHEKRHASKFAPKHVGCRNSTFKDRCDSSLFLPDDVNSALADRRFGSYSMEVKYLLDVYQYAKPDGATKRQIIEIVEKLLKNVFPSGGVSSKQLSDINGILGVNWKQSDLR